LKIPLPTHAEVLRLLKDALSSVRTEDDIDWQEIARQVDGMSCSEVVQISRNAAKSSILAGHTKIGTEHLKRAMEESLERGHVN
jgi:ATP-dependent 26S proteasome regulatory subunit